MTLDFNELYSRYISYIPDGTPADLIDWLDGDFDNWNCLGDDFYLTGLHGLLSYDESIWLYQQLTQLSPP